MLQTLIERFRPLADRLGVPLDKLLHFLAGFIVSAALILPFGGLAAWLGALAAGIAKEAYDRLDDDEGDVELADVYATWAGGTILPALTLLL